MDQDEANRIFETDLGRQLDIIYSTPDGRVFIREEEALNHIRDFINSGDGITEWFPET